MQKLTQAAAGLVEAMDFESLFADYGSTANGENDNILDKAQRNAVNRIRALIRNPT